MIQKAGVRLNGAGPLPLGPSFRYDALRRIGRCARERGVLVLAFGFAADELRLVLEGEPPAIQEAIRGLKVGTIRASIRWGLRLRTGDCWRSQVVDLLEAVVWAHRGPIEAGATEVLGSPWSSHRDLLGYRRSDFYDRRVLVHRVDPARVHRAFGVSPLRVPRPGARPDLSLQLRVAAAIRGVLPADRRCFRLFVHLARSRGVTNGEIADALQLTARRIRQLASEPEPDLTVATEVLYCPILSKVP